MRIVTCLLFSLILPPPQLAEAPAAPTPTADQANERLDLLLERTFDAFLELDPDLGRQVGEERFRGRMSVGIRPAERERLRQLLDSAMLQLSTFDQEQLSRQRQVWLRAFRFVLESQRDELRHPGHLLPLLPGFGTSTRFAQAASGAGDLDFRKAADHEALLSRIDDLEAWALAVSTNLKEGMEQGIVHPRPVVESLLRELRGQILATPEESPFHHPLRNLPEDLSPADRKALQQRLEKAIEDRILPIYSQLFSVLASDYLPRTRDTLGMAQLPGGKAWYLDRVRAYTTTELSPEEIFALGQAEVTRIQAAMRALARSAGYPDVPSFATAARSQGWSRRPEAIFRHFEKLEKKVRKGLPKLFGRRPESPFEIRQVEPFRSISAGGAFYERPDPRGGKPGVFYLNLRGGGFDLGSAEALFLHEALPGHHFQIALAQETQDLPRFLRFGYFGAYTEGWGLYCESLGEELGLYRDPIQRYGRLRYELGRASRLIADVGLHHKGWSRQEAESLLANQNLGWALGELERYATIPAQALSYKVGELRLQALRRKAQRALGKNFDLRAFHDLLLAQGPLPLTVLEDEVETWIRAREPAS